MKSKSRRKGGEVRDSAGREKIATHHEDMEEIDHAKHVGKVRGEHGKHTSARSPRKGGGGVGADRNPFSSAHGGTEPKGRHTMSD